jgi:hypothetical protein
LYVRSFVDYLLRLAAERYQLLAQWPDFSSAVSDFSSAV